MQFVMLGSGDAASHSVANLDSCCRFLESAARTPKVKEQFEQMKSKEFLDEAQAQDRLNSVPYMEEVVPDHDDGSYDATTITRSTSTRTTRWTLSCKLHSKNRFRSRVTDRRSAVQ